MTPLAKLRAARNELLDLEKGIVRLTRADDLGPADQIAVASLLQLAEAVAGVAENIRAFRSAIETKR